MAIQFVAVFPRRIFRARVWRLGLCAVTAALALSLAETTVAKAQATYNFVGVPFTTFPGDGGVCYLPTCQLSGSFTVPQALAPNMSQSVSGTGGITPSSFSFTDGLTTITDANASVSAFVFNTDANSNITQFAFSMSSAGVSFNALYTGPGGLTSESDTYIGLLAAHSGSIEAIGVPGGTWCLSYPPGSTLTSSAPCYLSNSILDFGDIVPGSSTPQQSVTIGNPSSTPLVVSGITIGPGYKQTNNCSTVAPGGVCTINVAFSPAASDVPNELLTITDNADSSPQTVYLYGQSFDVAAASATISSSLNPSGLGQSVTFTATVSGVSPLTGKFEFFDGLGDMPTSLGFSAVDSNGVATFTTSSLAVGTHAIFADYEAPDGSSVGELPLQQVVTAGQTGPAGFTLILSPTTATVTDGSSATITLTLTPQNGFNSAITLACGTLPSEASCNFNPQIVTPSSGAATAQLIFTTTAPDISQNRAPERPAGFGPAGALAGIALAALLWIAPRKGRVRRSLIVLIFTGALSIGLLSGCGVIKDLIKANTDPGTPKGTATVQVTATSGSGASAIVQASTFTVTIN